MVFLAGAGVREWGPADKWSSGVPAGVEIALEEHPSKETAVAERRVVDAASGNDEVAIGKVDS
jgi:hypothetical protein